MSCGNRSSVILNSAPVARTCKHALVSGRVQGVAFRWWTQRTAEELGLAGWVRNLADGRVEALVEGDEASVAEMLRWLRHGPEHARVTNLSVRAASGEGALCFEILPTAHPGA